MASTLAAFVGGARAAGLVVAALITVALIASSGRIGHLQALGWSLVAFVVFGPVIWPWYETWGFVFLAVVAEAWTLRIVLAFSALACFADVPGARFFGTNDPVLAVICWMLLSWESCASTRRGDCCPRWREARLRPSARRPYERVRAERGRLF